MNLATSKYCPSADQSLDTLENRYTLKQAFNLREFIDVCEAMEEAHHRDHENNMNTSQP